MKKITTQEFIERSKKVHDNRYDYSLVKYKGSSYKVKIICSEHGVFEQWPRDHYKGTGCPVCSQKRSNRTRGLSQEEFIKRAKKVHENRYDYSLVEYKGSRTKVKIICPEHGEFEQKAEYHLKGSQCPKCANSNMVRKGIKLTQEEFIERAKEVHGDKYDYSLVKYINSNEKVKIICPKHGVFEQNANNHINNKRGCILCSGKETATIEEFIKKAKEVHSDKYNYSLVNYINNAERVKIICPEHGVFFQEPRKHINRGQGCPVCALNNKSFSLEEFIEKAKEVHDNKYDYSLVKYANTNSLIKIICPIHGVFEQTPGNHLRSDGCKKCSNNGFSKGEKEVYDYIKSIYSGEILENRRDIIPPKELDIYIPEHKLGIEYHGLYWHSQQQLEKSGNNAKKYHYEKLLAAKKANIRLIQVFEDEWLNKEEIVKSRIKHMLGLYDKKIGARQVKIRTIDAKSKNSFLEASHIQGSDRSSFKYGAFYNNELVGVMTFCVPRVSLGRKEKKVGEYELSRFATKSGYQVYGLASKMFKHFVSNEEVTSVYTYSDLRWNKMHGTGSVYENIGMVFLSYSEPNYFYVVNNERKHRFGYRKQELHKKLNFFESSLTEYENMLQNGIDRVFDCGNEKYLWEKNYDKI